MSETWQDVLRTPVAVGPLTVANRLSIAPHTVNFGITKGYVDDSFVAYLRRRAGGFGVTMVPLAAPAPSGRAEPSQPWLWDDRWVGEVAKVADAIRAAGSEPGLQINHGGRQTNRRVAAVESFAVGVTVEGAEAGPHRPSSPCGCAGTGCTSRVWTRHE
jgi:2,4-dienoyl-CoA reductase-like NADH-dependent reductase (Old Yellow Enzyme family)